MARWYWHRYNNLFSLKLVFTIIPKLPRFVHPPIAAVTALLFLILLPRERKNTYKNLTVVCRGAGKPRLWWSTYRVFYSFCDFVVGYCYVPRTPRLELKEMLVDGCFGADKTGPALELGKGLIVWTAHLGNWELGSRLLELTGRPVNVARMVENDKPAELMLRELMTNDRLKIVQLNDNPYASLELLSALRRNEVVAIQGDRVYRGFSAEVPFFGTMTSFPFGAFYLSYLSGAPLIPGFVIREKWLRYRVVMGDPIAMTQTEDRERQMRAALAIAVKILEEQVRVHPDQWLNFYDFWPENQARQPDLAAEPVRVVE